MVRAWAKLEELRRRCEVEIRSYLGPESTLCWRVTLRDRSSPTVPFITTSDPDITDALRNAVSQAAERGWVSRGDGPRPPLL